MKSKITLLLIATVISGQSIAKSLTFTPAISVDETYSDNLELSNNDKQSGLVSQINVGLDSQYKSNTSSFSLNSTSTYAIYSYDHSLDTDYHALNASGSTQLWPNGLTLSGSTNIDNVARNLANNSSDSLLFSDTVQTENYQAGLSYSINNRYHIASGSLDFSKSTSEDNLGESERSGFNIHSENGSAARRFFWDSSLSNINSDNTANDSEQTTLEIKLGLITNNNITPFIRYYLEDNTGNVSSTSLETESYGFGVRWLIIPRLYIDVSYNEPFDSNDDEQGSFADVLLNWQPSSRTQIELTHSQRFFGDSYGLNLTHQNRRLTNRISYTESVQAFTRDNFESVTSDDGTETTLELVEDNSFSLNKRFSWTSTLAFTRTTFNFIANYTDRENLGIDDAGSDNLTKTVSFNALRNISRSTSLSLTTSFTDQEIQASNTRQSDQYRRYSLGYNKNIGSLLNLSLSIVHTNRGSSVDNFNYTENRFTFILNKDF